MEGLKRVVLYRKIPKISPSMHKPLNPVMGYSRKNPHPHDGRHGFLTPPPPHPPGFPKLLEPPSTQDFQVQRPPTPLDFHKIVRHHDFTLHSMWKNPFRHLDDLFIK